jgi:hypothetical protein
MRAQPKTTEVRRIVLRMFHKFGASPGNLFEMQETTRIDRGRCMARCYRVEEMMAMWLTEVGIVQFYDAAGAMLATINLLQQITPEPMAA